ncbi:MAG: tRNA lysidine(34) synthetase TilS [Bacteroidales bacterium]|nr:tRNA lysidine(34) synthetase TilS [Bacteroidales bacterium]
MYPIDNHSTADIVLDVFKIPEGFDYKNPPAGHLYTDAEKIGLTVTGRHCIKSNGSLETIGCRKWQDGDRFRPLGMKGWKKLSDYFTDKKLDIEQKRQQMILTTSAGDQSNAIFAIVGHCIDHRFRITKETRLVAEIYQSI